MSDELTSWPYQEAREIVAKLEREKGTDRENKRDFVLLETGYGPSGLPHIGTFAEVARTTWVRHAFEELTGTPTTLYAFSDDLDGLRKVPDNLPNQDLLLEHLGKPLCEIPDPFGETESFSGYMNRKLQSFLDHFGFDYEFKSSKDQYRGGVFNDGLHRILERYDAVRDVILPTLGQKKGDGTDRSSWSPFMPICESCGRVYTTRVTDTHPEDGEISYVCDASFKNCDACGHEGRTKVTDGRVKVGWKVDWALRWYSFGVDYEMYGKDLIESAELSAKIVKVLGGEPPVGMFYEMFLDENGQKISKSKGNGMEIDEWLQYGPLESLSWFIYQNPKKAKKLYFDVIPKSVDDFLDARSKFGSDDEDDSRENPVWFIEHDRIEQGGDVGYASSISYSMLLNLVNVLNTDDKEIVWNYLLKYDANARSNEEVMNRMIDRALAYYREFVLPTKEFVRPDAEMQPAIDQLIAFLESADGATAEEIQSATYSAGKENGLKLGKWFKAMYQLLLGQERGPRLGTFIELYGVDDTLQLIRTRMAELPADGDS